jgi:Arc/MetJ family transcription regulator
MPIVAPPSAMPADAAVNSALRAVLRDNTGRTTMLAKTQAFTALPVRSQIVDLKV